AVAHRHDTAGLFLRRGDLSAFGECIGHGFFEPEIATLLEAGYRRPMLIPVQGGNDHGVGPLLFHELLPSLENIAFGEFEFFDQRLAVIVPGLSHGRHPGEARELADKTGERGTPPPCPDDSDCFGFGFFSGHLVIPLFSLTTDYLLLTPSFIFVA